MASDRAFAGEVAVLISCSFLRMRLQTVIRRTRMTPVDGVPNLTVADHVHRLNWTSRLPSCSLLRMYSRITISSRPIVDAM